MITRLIELLLMVLVVAIPGFAQESGYPFQQDELWGYRDSRGNVVIAPRYIIAHDFLRTGIAAVVDSQGWAYIDRDGEVVVRPFVVDNGPDYFMEGWARLILDGKFGFFDSTGHIVIPPQFDFASPFREGRAAVATGCRVRWEGEMRVWEGGCWGFIDREGGVVIPLRYEAVEPFSGGQSRVKLQGHWITVDRNGNLTEE